MRTSPTTPRGFTATSEVMFPLFIVNGITGVRDLGSNLEATLAARDSVAAHQLIGPRMLVSGPMLDGPTTRYAAAIKVATGDEARAAVRMLKERGVDMIKTQSLIPKDAYFALADEAARIGIPFEGHVPNAITGMEAIAANQRSFEHLLGVRDTATSLIAELARRRVWQCPTVINSVGTAADFTNDPGVAVLAAAGGGRLGGAPLSLEPSSPTRRRARLTERATQPARSHQADVRLEDSVSRGYGCSGGLRLRSWR